MTIIFAVTLTVLTFIWVIYPFFRHKTQLSPAGGNEKLEELRSERDTTYSMLKELEFDYQSGITTEEDYKELEARYKRKAISTLREIDNAGRGGSAEPELDEIEQQVQKLRKNRSKTGARAGKPAERKFCPQCGSQVGDKDKFCAGCGASLTAGGRGG